MRRYLLLVLFVIVLATPFVLRVALGLQARPEEYDLRLVIMSPHQEGIRREFQEAFSRWHKKHHGQSVFVEYLSYGGSDIVKILNDRTTLFKNNGTYGIDLVWGGGDYLFDQQLKKAGHLDPIDFKPAYLNTIYPTPDINGVALYDPAKTPAWFGTALSSFGIVYNKDLVRHLQTSTPRTWADLADPRYYDWIALADATRSSSAKAAYMTIVERAMADAREQGRSEDEGWARGMGLIRQIAANARLFTESSSIVPIQVSTGDAAAGMAIDFYGRSQAESVGDDRMAYIEPRGATIINPDPIALVKGAPNRQLAVRFIEFVLSEEGQALWNTRAGAPGGPRQSSLRRLPVRQSSYADMTHFTDPVNPFTEAGGFNTSNARKKTFGILGELIQWSCIDLLDELKQTRRAILQSPRAKELDARLGKFPFDQKEALARAAEYAKATQARKLELARKWTDEFREEYRRLRQEAAQ